MEMRVVQASVSKAIPIGRRALPARYQLFAPDR